MFSTDFPNVPSLKAPFWIPGHPVSLSLQDRSFFGVYLCWSSELAQDYFGVIPASTLTLSVRMQTFSTLFFSCTHFIFHPVSPWNTDTRYTHCEKTGKLLNGTKGWINADLQYYSVGLLPGVCAGAEAMGRPWDTVIALSIVNISHVIAALLLNSLFLCLRHRKARRNKMLSKHISAIIISDTTASSCASEIPNMEADSPWTPLWEHLQLIHKHLH